MNRTLLITGASSGIGAACAIRGAASGTHLLLHYGANREGVEEVADTARIAGAEVTLIQADVGSSDDITRLGREAAEATDPSLPLHLINNAGVVDQTATIADMTPDRLHRMFGINTIDPLTFIGVPLVLGGTALFAAYLPARRASRINPVAALRTE